MLGVGRSSLDIIVFLVRSHQFVVVLVLWIVSDHKYVNVLFPAGSLVMVGSVAWLLSSSLSLASEWYSPRQV